MGIVRDGGKIGYVGVPHGMSGLPLSDLFGRNIGVGGGVAPTRQYLPELLADVLAGRIDPSPVFDKTMPLDDVAEAYREMDERTALKVIIKP
jgi:threonine dehydrogenase-like Zn-dependent dehydrogenase